MSQTRKWMKRSRSWARNSLSNRKKTSTHNSLAVVEFCATFGWYNSTFEADCVTSFSRALFSFSGFEITNKQVTIGTVQIGPIRARTLYPTSRKCQDPRYPTLLVSIATKATNPMATPINLTRFTTVRPSTSLVRADGGHTPNSTLLFIDYNNRSTGLYVMGLITFVVKFQKHH